MLQSLSVAQTQVVLQYLYSSHSGYRREAIRWVGEEKLSDPQLLQAVTELAALDPDDDVRKAARTLLAQLEI